METQTKPKAISLPTQKRWRITVEFIAPGSKQPTLKESRYFTLAQARKAYRLQLHNLWVSRMRTSALNTQGYGKTEHFRICLNKVTSNVWEEGSFYHAEGKYVKSDGYRMRKLENVPALRPDNFPVGRGLNSAVVRAGGCENEWQ